MSEVDFSSLNFGSLSEKDWYENIEPGTAVILFPPNQEESPAKTVDIYGLGIYEGKFPSPVSLDAGEGGLTITLDDSNQIIDVRADQETDMEILPTSAQLMPRMRLLHNEVVIWGYECFWRPVVVDGVNILVETLGRGGSLRIIDIEADRAKFLRKTHPDIQN